MLRQLAGSMPAWSRPIRVPPEIEITHADPPVAVAGETSSWTLRFVLSRGVPAGSTLKLQLAGGRNNKGPFRGAAPTAGLADGTPLAVSSDVTSGSFVLTLPAAGLALGDAVAVLLSDARAPETRQLNKFFVLHVAPGSGEGQGTPGWAGGSAWAPGSSERIVAVCTMHVLGGTIDHLRAYAPAGALPGEELSILIRPEDAFGNLAHERPGALAVRLGAEELAATFEDVAESTCIRARVALPRAGTHRLCIVESSTGREATTNPIVCGAPAERFWGMIHGHTEMSDGTGTLDQYFHQLQNEVGLDFAASADHDHRWETPDAFWGTTQDAVRRWHQPGRFVTFLGYEWAKWRRNGNGDRNVCYLEDARPMYRSDDGDFPSPPDLFAALARNRERAIVIPHHTGHAGNFCDWMDHDGSVERLVEVFQVRGSYECREAEGNPVPERRTGQAPCACGYVRDALALGWRVGFTAGGDDHSGQWGTEAPMGFGYKQGLMCVEASARTREAIFAAMHARRVVATTGARILLTYRLDGWPMGAELSVQARPHLASCRRLAVEVHGTGPIERVEIIRNHAVVHSLAAAAGPLDLEFAWEDHEPIADVWLPPAKFCSHPFAFYYVRVLQADGEVAWASPVWVDP